MKNDYPKHAGYSSAREFKAAKRKQVKHVLRILNDEALCGIAYSPAYDEFEKAVAALERAIELQSVKNWGR